MATHHVHVYTTAFTPIFDKLLLAEKRAAHDERLRWTDVRVTYQYHVDGALVFYVPGR